jgi:hypothetical protein
MTRTRKILTALGAAGLVLGTASTASAAPASGSPPISWLGSCYPWHDSQTGGGWCDGQGPNWTYRAWVQCKGNGITWVTMGPSHWAGDRRGSYGYCSTEGGNFLAGFIMVYYNGELQYDISM